MGQPQSSTGLNFSGVFEPPPQGQASELNFSGVFEDAPKPSSEAAPTPAPSALRRVLDVALTPTVSPEAARRVVGAEGPTPQASILSTIGSLLSEAPNLMRGMIGGALPSSDPVVGALQDVATNIGEPNTIPAMARGAAQGAVEGAAQLTTPVDLASFLTMGLSRAVARPTLAAVRALDDATRAFVAARLRSAPLAEIQALRAEMAAMRTAAEKGQALLRFAGGTDRAAAGAIALSGVERGASAENPGEFAAGTLEAALGGLGLRTSPVMPALHPQIPTHAAELPAARGFRVTPDGAAVPADAAIPPRPAAPDPSYVRAEPAQYARREPRGALPPGPRFVADDAGRVAVLEAADQLLTARIAEKPAGADATAAAKGKRGKKGAQETTIAPRAAVMDRQLGNAPVYSSDPAATSIKAVPLEPAEAVEIRGMLAEMDAMPFTRHTFIDPGVGKGGSPEIVPGAGGASVYQDIVNLHGGSGPGRDALMDAMRKTLEGEPSTYGVAIREAARMRLNNRIGRELPPDAGVREPHMEPGRMADDDFDQFSSFVDDQAALGPDALPGERAPGQEGRVPAALALHLGGGAAGAAAGYASGESDEDRLQRALMFGVAGFAAPSLLRGGGASRLTGAPDAARPGGTQATSTGSTVAVADALPTTGRPAPRPERPMANPLRGVDVFLEKFPEEMRGGLRHVLEDNAGFQAQRRGSVSQEQIDRLAEQVRVDAQRRLRPGTALNASEIRMHVDALAGAQAKVNDLAARVRRGQNTDADVLALESARAEVNTLLASVMGARSEAGRALAQWRTLARIMAVGNPELMATAAGALRGNAAEFAAQFAQVGGDDISRYRWLHNRMRPDLRERVRQYYYANILSGLKTHERNILGNTFNTLTNFMTKPVAAGLDAVKAKALNRPREVFFSEIPSDAVGAFVGLQRGFSDALFSARYGVNRSALTQSLSAGEAGKLDVPRIEFTGGGANPFNWPGRALDSADQFFRGVARDSRLYSLAHAQAKREGRREHGLTVRMAELVTGTNAKNVTDPIAQRLLSEVDEYARRTVFQERGGRFVKSLQVLAEQVPEVSIVLPFIRTPGNILRQGFEFSPAGFLMKAARVEGRTGTEAQARALMGSVALGGLAYLLATDQIEITGSGPVDRTGRAAWMESGRRPNSVRVGDQYVEFTLLQPISVPLMALANAMEAWKASGAKEQDAGTIAVEVARKTARSVVDMSFLSGVADLFAAIEEGAGWGVSRIASRTAHSLTPFSGAQRTVMTATDPVVRKPDGVVEGVKANVPGLSSSVPARLDRFGRDVRRPGGALRRAADPFNVSAATSDPVLVELDRVKAPVGFPGDRVGDLDLSRDQKRAVSMAKGSATHSALRRMFESPVYQRLGDEAKRRAVAKLVARVRAAEAKRLAAEFKGEAGSRARKAEGR